jgi:4a-hydroxytetrahydrobiopterin dehydratase
MEITVIQLDDLSKKNWKFVDGKLTKVYYFQTYTEVISFTNQVFNIVEKHNHHPELTIGYNTVTVSVNNHEERNVSDKCYLLAKDLDFINNIPSI